MERSLQKQKKTKKNHKTSPDLAASDQDLAGSAPDLAGTDLVVAPELEAGHLVGVKLGAGGCSSKISNSSASADENEKVWQRTRRGGIPAWRRTRPPPSPGVGI
jgi:hypothetical protein